MRSSLFRLSGLLLAQKILHHIARNCFSFFFFFLKHFFLDYFFFESLRRFKQILQYYCMFTEYNSMKTEAVRIRKNVKQYYCCPCGSCCCYKVVFTLFFQCFYHNWRREYSTNCLEASQVLQWTKTQPRKCLCLHRIFNRRVQHFMVPSFYGKRQIHNLSLRSFTMINCFRLNSNNNNYKYFAWVKHLQTAVFNVCQTKNKEDKLY